MTNDELLAVLTEYVRREGARGVNNRWASFGVDVRVLEGNDTVGDDTCRMIAWNIIGRALDHENGLANLQREMQEWRQEQLGRI